MTSEMGKQIINITLIVHYHKWLAHTIW